MSDCVGEPEACLLIQALESSLYRPEGSHCRGFALAPDGALRAVRSFMMNALPPTELPVRRPVVVPSELQALLRESAKAQSSFQRLSERERRGFCSYVDEATRLDTRERRAAIVAMSLIGLAQSDTSPR